MMQDLDRVPPACSALPATLFSLCSSEEGAPAVDARHGHNEGEVGVDPALGDVRISPPRSQLDGGAGALAGGMPAGAGAAGAADCCSCSCSRSFALKSTLSLFTEYTHAKITPLKSAAITGAPARMEPVNITMACWMRAPPDLPMRAPSTSMAALPLSLESSSSGMYAISLVGSKSAYLTPLDRTFCVVPTITAILSVSRECVTSPNVMYA
mmetsp:Transcript_15100/g.39230  ORF Transcript_15100/g.39230 Transcript_15100/m.39230 type:complete len:211 (+) Transcript_15100:102-734(+)